MHSPSEQIIISVLFLSSEHGATGLSFTEGGHEQNIEEENPDEIMDTESKTNEGQTNEHGELLFSPSMVSGESPVDAEPV